MSKVTGAPFRTIRLPKVALTYLANTNFLSDELNQIVNAAVEPVDGDCVLKLDLATAERFRDEFTSRLARVGFDSNYMPTRDGELLEDLIDRFAK